MFSDCIRETCGQGGRGLPDCRCVSRLAGMMGVEDTGIIREVAPSIVRQLQPHSFRRPIQGRGAMSAHPIPKPAGPGSRRCTKWSDENGERELERLSSGPRLCRFLDSGPKALSDNPRSPGSGPHRVRGAHEHLLRAGVQGIMPATKFLKELNKKTFQTSD